MRVQSAPTRRGHRIAGPGKKNNKQVVHCAGGLHKHILVDRLSSFQTVLSYAACLLMSGNNLKTKEHV